MAPQLPPEIISMILEHALPSSTTPTSSLDVHFSRTREQIHDKSLASFIASGGRNWLGFGRNLLWHDVHVGSSRRAEKLIESLSLELPGDPLSKGYLVPLIQRLEIDIRERPLPLPRKDDRDGPTKRPRFEKAHQDGILPVQIAQLATLVSHLESLSINVAVPGGWLSHLDMFEALHRFVERDKFRNLEIVSTGLGFRNCLSIFAESPKLETLKLRGIRPDWTLLEGERESNLAILNRPNPPLPYSFSSTLSKLVLWECRLDLQEFVDLLSSLPSLRHLVLHRLESREPNLGRSAIAFPSPTLIPSLIPLVPQLETFHFVLPLSASTSIPPLPLDVLSSHFTAFLKTLVLGGPRLFSHPTLLDNLIERGSHHDFRPLSTTFTQCTFEGERGRQFSGLRATDLVKALEENWASELEVLDVEGMTDDGEAEKKYWDSIELEKLKEKVEMVNSKKREEGKRGLVLRYDEELEQREREEREWEERRRNRNRGARGGRGRARR
ncbi:hypothetical protein JCM5350_007168 [Sporobolomyces pararoseus]